MWPAGNAVRDSGSAARSGRTAIIRSASSATVRCETVCGCTTGRARASVSPQPGRERITAPNLARAKGFRRWDFGRSWVTMTSSTPPLDSLLDEPFASRPQPWRGYFLLANVSPRSEPSRKRVVALIESQAPFLSSSSSVWPVACQTVARSSLIVPIKREASEKTSQWPPAQIPEARPAGSTIQDRDNLHRNRR